MVKTAKKTAKKKAAKKKAARRQTKTKTGDIQTMQSLHQNLLRKITNKTVLGDNIPKPEEPTELYKLFGVISGYQVGKSDYGEYVKFKGDFVAHVIEGGEEFRAPNAIVPVPMDGVLAQMYDNAVKSMADPETGEVPTGKAAQVQFAVMVGYKPSNSPMGYEWTVTPQMEMQENDVILALRRQVLGLEHQEE